MIILVPIKRVPDPYAKVRPLADGSGLDTSGLKFEINPFDEIALEEAVRLRERNGDITIHVVSIGPPGCEDSLRKALAMGADKALLLGCDEPIDSLQIASELKKIAVSLQADLILMGKQATDDDNNQVGQMLAALLGWPQATFASKVTLEGPLATVTRETDSGEETVSFTLPGVITADLRLNEPRYIALPGIIKARNKPLEKRPFTQDRTSNVRTVAYELAPARPPGRKVGSVAELVEELSKAGAL